MKGIPHRNVVLRHAECGEMGCVPVANARAHSTHIHMPHRQTPRERKKKPLPATTRHMPPYPLFVPVFLLLASPPERPARHFFCSSPLPLSVFLSPPGYGRASS